MDETENSKPSAVVADTARFFGDDTPLQRAPEVGGRPYEPRPQQADMAAAVAEHLIAGRHLCIEAPTGVGKTFAYLVPAILFARERGVPVIVSTHTISLQEQVLDRDLPVLAKLMGVEFRAALAKGRSNYLCRRRLDALVGLHQDYLPSPDLVPEIEQLYRWAAATEDGSLSSLDFEPTPALWESVCCEIGNCLNAKCPFIRDCFLAAARRQIEDAQIVVANHALLFTDLAMKTASASEDGGILPAYGAVILDEGHTIEDAAATRLGLHLTSFGLRRLLYRLYHPERNRGLLVDLEYTEARLAVIAAVERTESFFVKLGDWLAQQADGPLRYTVPGHIPNLVGAPLREVEIRLTELAPAEKDTHRQAELKALSRQLQEYREGLQAFLSMEFPERVYWFERYGQDRRHIALNAVPIEIAPVLRERLFGDRFTVVVTSATLAIRGQMEYFQHRLVAENADSMILGSPFNFARQVQLYLPFNMPSPKDTATFVPAACERIREFLLKTNGKAFVLFTSYSMMQEVQERLAGFFAQSGLTLFVQGEGLPRSKMLQAFREDINSVIFGTASFWTGVDVPGEALSNVIIVKLPFAVPDHPLVAARQELIERRGGRPFWEYSLPEAVLKFRQGFGRLIRSRDDTGIVVVLDNRILRTSYGKTFLDSIPQCERHVF